MCDMCENDRWINFSKKPNHYTQYGGKVLNLCDYCYLNMKFDLIYDKKTKSFKIHSEEILNERKGRKNQKTV